MGEEKKEKSGVPSQMITVINDEKNAEQEIVSPHATLSISLGKKELTPREIQARRSADGTFHKC